MTTRNPIVAGQFYPDVPEQCRQEAEQCLAARTLDVTLPEHVVAGIVPHAGWVFSGDVAGMVFQALQRTGQVVDVVVLLGASHRYAGAHPAVWAEGRWAGPLGPVAVDGAMAREILEHTSAEDRPEAHRGEHSIEVQIPLLRVAFPSARIVPIVVPATCEAVQFGKDLSRVLQGRPSVVCIASTDLTHYGPRYGFTPAGQGAKGLAWAKSVNDARFIEAALAMDAEAVQSGALETLSACGPGAAGAAVAAARELGREKGILLAHTTSAEVMQRFGQSSDEAVGYAAVVY